MSKRNDKELLEDMLQCARRINSYIEKMTYDDFLIDHKTQDAVVRNIEIIGEAVKLLSDDIKRNYSGIAWKEIAGTRDKLIHDYFGINIDVVWNIAKEDLPTFVEELEKIS
ncbi:MAG TPA: DUF86 domain-containing protein [Syntrophorhabdaceae bacterium]|nr:DUF86 domain-containing protein [Syntrophorhabdaceae bacterium]